MCIKVFTNFSLFKNVVFWVLLSKAKEDLSGWVCDSSGRGRAQGEGGFDQQVNPSAMRLRGLVRPAPGKYVRWFDSHYKNPLK